MLHESFFPSHTVPQTLIVIYGSNPNVCVEQQFFIFFSVNYCVPMLLLLFAIEQVYICVQAHDYFANRHNNRSIAESFADICLLAYRLAGDAEQLPSAACPAAQLACCGILSCLNQKMAGQYCLDRPYI